MDYPKLTDALRLQRLTPPAPDAAPVDMVLDTDTFNEIDDQFALAYALLSPTRMNCLAVYAAPFHNKRSTGPEDGMVKSYEEILRLLELMKRQAKGFAFEGSRSFMSAAETPVESPAAADLVQKARARDAASDGPLYVVAIGAITNVASAILMAPDIVKNIVVVWLGGQPHYWRSTREFNLSQDLHAARVILESGAPFVHVPCRHVAQLLRTTATELREYVAGRSALGDFLVERFMGYHSDHYCWAKEIWDLAPVAWLVDHRWLPGDVVHSPILTDQHTWSVNPDGHFMRVATDCNRNAIFADVFTKLANAK